MNPEATIDGNDALAGVRHALRGLERAIAGLRGAEVAIGAGENNQIVEDWPIPGRRRFVLSSRRVSGTDNFPVLNGTASDVLPHTPGRGGGQIVNYGANAVILYLAGANRVNAAGGSTGVPAIWLAANGGAWDFLLGSLEHGGGVVWTGHVSVVGQAGTSSLTVAVW